MSRFVSNLPKFRPAAKLEEKKEGERKNEPEREKKGLGYVIARRLDLNKKKAAQNASSFRDNPLYEELSDSDDNVNSVSSSHKSLDDLSESVRVSSKETTWQSNRARPSTARTSVQPRSQFLSQRRALANKSEKSEKSDDDFLQSLLVNLQNPEDGTEVQKQINAESPKQSLEDIIVSPRFKHVQPSAAAQEFRRVADASTAQTIVNEKISDAIDRKRPTKKADRRQGFKRAEAKILTEVDVPSIRKNLPLGMILDIKGNISGTQQVTTYPPTEENKHSGTPIVNAIREGQNKLLSDTSMLDGVKVVEFATRDFNRMTYEIPMKDGHLNPLPLPTDEEAGLRALDDQSLMALESKIKQAKETLRNEQIARALKDFVQDDDKTSTQNNAATLVLSSLMTQHIPDVMQQVCYLSYPQFTGYPKVPFRALSRGTAKDNNGKARPLTMKNSSGEVEPVTVKGVGGDAIFALSRDGENFKVTLNYPTYVEARPGRENEFPLHENGVVLIHLKTEILVNGDQARDGKLEIAMPNGIQAEYSGRLMLS